MKVSLLDLKAQYATIRPEIESAVLRALEASQYIMGPDVAELEKAVQEKYGVAHAISCANGSDAIRLALMSLGVGAGDEVIVPTYTFFATAGAVSLVGATPVFCDIERDTYNIDPAQIEKLITSKTKAIIPVHLYGQCADLDAVKAVALRHNIPVIEDAAQAIGAMYKGKFLGQTGGDITTLSFFPSKNLGCAGDGGMVLTNDSALAEKLRVLRVHGGKPKYFHKVIGFNSRLDTVQAAILNVKLKHLDTWTDARNRNALTYRERLASLAEKEAIALPHVAPYTTRHVYNQFVIRALKRDELRAHLQAAGIGTEIYYPLPLHQQECFLGGASRVLSAPEAESAAAQTLALPIYPELSSDQIEYVCKSLEKFFQ